MCKYRLECGDYSPKECHCEPELCFLYDAFLEEAEKQLQLDEEFPLMSYHVFVGKVRNLLNWYSDPQNRHRAVE